jgi:hypothetical protein
MSANNRTAQVVYDKLSCFSSDHRRFSDQLLLQEWESNVCMSRKGKKNFAFEL